MKKPNTLSTYLFFSIISIFLFSKNNNTHAQAPIIEWEQNYGSTQDDAIYSKVLTPDGGLLILGNANATNFDVTSDNTDKAYWLLRLDADGNKLWDKSIITSFPNGGGSMKCTSDGGFIIFGRVGVSSGSGGGIIQIQPHDFLMVKLDADGNVEWQNSWGGTSLDWGIEVIEASDGGYIAMGTTASSGFNTFSSYGNYDAIVIKVDSNGNLEWMQNYGGTRFERGKDIIQDTDGNYVLLIYTDSNDTDLNFNNGFNDVWVVKINPIGNIIWQKLYGTAQFDIGNEIIKTADGGFMVVGFQGIGDNYKGILYKLDSNGDLEWEKKYGPSNRNIGIKVHQKSDGNYIVGGRVQTGTTTGIFSGQVHDWWLFEVDSNGEMLWEGQYGGSRNEYLTTLMLLDDDTYLVGGTTRSDDGDVGGNYGSNNPIDNYYHNDIWLVRFKNEECAGVTASVNPTEVEICEGQGVVIDADNNFTSYQWSNGVVIPSNFVNEAGTYTVTVTNANGCTATAETVVTEFSLSGDLIKNLPEYCAGEDALLGVGNSYTNVQWSTGSNNNSITVSTPGIYSVTVTSDNGCTGTSEVEVVPDPTPSIDLSNNSNAFCSGASISINSNIIASTYEWSNGGTNSSIEVNTAGTYSVTITAASGCTNTDEIFITENPTPIFNITPTSSSFCTGGSVDLNINNTFSNYNWSDGNTTEMISVNSAGTYSVTVTDGNNCTAESEITISENPLPTANASVSDDLTCTNTSVILQSAGSATGNNIVYTWLDNQMNNLGNTPDLDVSEAGTYTLNVTDTSTGCSSSTTVEVIEEVQPLSVNIDIPQQLTCEITSTTLSSNLTNPTSNVAYQWLDNQGNTLGNDANLTTSEVGEYTLIVTNLDNGCTSTIAQTVSANVNLPEATIEVPQSLTCDILTTTLNVILNNAISNPAFQWLDNQGNILGNEANLTASEVGEYTLIVTDLSNGCSATFSQTVTSNTDLPEATIEVPQQLTCDITSTTLNAILNNPISNVAFQWLDNQGNILGNEENLTASEVGEYTLIVTNIDNGCTYTSSQMVTSNASLPEATIEVPQPLTCDITTTNLNAVLTNPISNVAFQWLDNQGNILGNESILTASEVGEYTLVVTNLDNGCSTSISQTVSSEANLPEVTIDIPQQLTCEITSTALNAILNNPISNVAFLWIDSQGNILGNDANLTTNEIGEYTLVVTDLNNGCTATTSQIVTANTNIPDAVINTPQVLNCNNTIITLDGTGSATGNDISYDWQDPNGNSIGNNNTITISTAGTYSLLVTDETNGCNNTTTITVIEDFSTPTVNAGTDEALPCNITNNSFTLNSSGSSVGNNFEYQWTTANGNFTSNTNISNPTINAAGIYQLTILNTTNGCTATDEVSLTVENGIENATLDITNPICHNDENGSLEILNVAGGTAPYEYAINGNEFSNNNTFTNLTSGDYDILIQDSNGCLWADNFTLDNPTEFTINPLTDLTVRIGNKVELSPQINIPVSNIESIQWTPSEGLECSDCLTTIAQPDVTTTYSLQIITIDGCIATTQITVIVDGEIKVWELISPYNKDGKNDDWTIAGIDQFPDNEVIIFNRLGDIIYEAKPYNNENPWDGTYKNEKLVPAGIYYFLIRYSLNDPKILKGRVVVVD